jgi:hypothetical protein
MDGRDRLAVAGSGREHEAARQQTAAPRDHRVNCAVGLNEPRFSRVVLRFMTASGTKKSACSGLSPAPGA